jgi:type VI secretion system protein VasG
MIRNISKPAAAPGREARAPNATSVPFTYDDDVLKLIVARCTELESGGRMIDAILTNTILPTMSREFLERMMAGREIEKVEIGVKDGEFTYQFD